MKKKILIIGAGAIGRGFAAKIFSDAGYTLSFVENDPLVYEELKARHSYMTAIASGNRYEEVIIHYDKVFISTIKAQEYIKECDAVITAVGPENCKQLSCNLKSAKCIYILENDINIIKIIKETSENPNVFFGIPDVIASNTASPELLKKDSLCVVTETGRLVLEKSPCELVKSPDIDIVDEKELLKHWWCKFYIHNAPHAITAYLGALKDYVYIHQAMADPKISGVVINAMNLMAKAVAMDNRVSEDLAEDYKTKELLRFSNNLMYDPISRVARDPLRKLDSNERLIQALLIAKKYGLNTQPFLMGVKAALNYKKGVTREDKRFEDHIEKKGTENFVGEICEIKDSLRDEIIGTQVNDIILRNKVILLMGAGASSLLGFPLLKELLDNEMSEYHPEESSDRLQCRRCVFSGEDQIETKANQDLLTAYGLVRDLWERGKAHGGSLEELMGQLIRYIQETDKLKQDRFVQNIIGNCSDMIDPFVDSCNSALSLCYTMLAKYYNHESSLYKKGIYTEHDLYKKGSENYRKAEKIISLLSKLAGFNKTNGVAQPLQLFTTNYDTFFYFISDIDSQDIHICNSIPEPPLSEKVYLSPEPEIITHDKVNAETKQHVVVHRMHGCVAWFMHEKDKMRQIKMETLGELDRKIAGLDKKFRVMGNVFLNRMVIKLLSDNTILGKYPFTQEYEEFNKSLKDSSALIVWGFSFRDAEIVRKIQEAWTQSRGRLKIYYIDPYLSKDKATDNIRRTLETIPGHGGDNNFRVQRIHWSVNNSIDVLKDNILSALNKSRMVNHETE
ncbi:MAG: SIR2 family protein [Proteobacteria bacterium]|nr:SIR2 family protein [Pseudomonadota bacterium]